MRQAEDFTDGRPFCLHGRKMGQEAILRVGSERNSVAGNKCKEAFDEVRVGRGLLWSSKVNAIAQDGKIAVRQARAAITKTSKQRATAAFSGIHQIDAGAENGSRTAVISAHQPRGVFGIHLILRCEIEDVAVPAGDRMHFPTNAKQKLALLNSSQSRNSPLGNWILGAASPSLCAHRMVWMSRKPPGPSLTFGSRW